jgi:hypothetical protein
VCSPFTDAHTHIVRGHTMPLANVIGGFSPALERFELSWVARRFGFNSNIGTY